ncbi:two-component system sensor histidine kinase/response regulator, hybrid ('one-component system') [Pedobacter sp. BAL39]|uniref:hybrid sensor histidine kinase/response regulator transcription factor n=1 Tax=Pedobacter sp. BAL39 TaxID=391596 RepID=UPI0001559901|nr:two-component regulator propeller domain-containing protein [Pedobacter sp. BAL39]EDM37209.1 two-component system sensor histidine kinase/response regulator, hybrid ('one-component system') [Pedobacter sp. BAL39]
MLVLSIFVIDSRAIAMPVPAGAMQFYYQQFDNRNGLSNSAVNVLFQDSDQLLWVGTWDGLNMHDGTDFRVFNYSSDQAGSIGNNVIQDVKEDQRGNIWISTIGGITRFEKRSGKFYRYFYNGEARRSIGEREYELVVASDGHVFCYSKSHGLSVFNQVKDTFQALSFLPGNTEVVRIVAGKDRQIWFLQRNGTLSIGQTRAGNQLALVKRFRPSTSITNLYFVNNTMLLSDVQNNLWKSDVRYRMTRVARMPRGIRAISYYQSFYMVAWESQGVAAFDASFRPAGFLQQEVARLAGTKVTTIHAARDEVLWLGTDGNGLIKIFPRVNQFLLVSPQNRPELNRPVRAFAAVGRDLWVGTKGKGILQMHHFWEDAGRPVTTGINTTNGLDNNAVYAILKGYGPYVYIGTDGRGITIYDESRKRVVGWRELSGTARLPDFGSVYAILQDRDSSLWIGTSGSGLVHLRISADPKGILSVTEFKQYLSNSGNGLANNIIYALSNGSDGRLWIACRYGGLSVLDKQKGTFKTFKAFTYTNSLSNNDVLSLYEDQQRRLWIGTSYGLNMLSPSESKREQPVFKRFTMEEGLPNNTIHAIEEANSGNIWLSTNKGLARLNPDNGAVSSFRESEGLQSNEFSDGAVWKSSNGTLYFGGIYGFNYFRPEEIRGDQLQPNLLISRVQMGGQTIDENRLQVIKPSASAIPEYTLERKNNFFQLSIKSMSFLNEAKNEFAYKLEGLDKTWTYSTSSGNIARSNIPPGNYTLLIRWSDGEGEWTTGTRVFRLQVDQYFWLTYPAILLYLVVIIASGYAFHTYRKNKLQMKYQLQMESLLRQKDEVEHQQRLNFFTNIAHEIQTPLTMIMGSVEHFLQTRENNYFISLVHQHTARLTYLVQQLLEFRKAEAGYLKRNDDYVDISKMLDSLSVLFTQGSEQHHQTYLREIQEGMAGFVDKDKLEKILYNLLSNAFKHSGNGETVVFKATCQQETKMLYIEVSNSGCMLGQEDLEQIFSKFYVSNDRSREKFSTGIGLAFTRELITLMDAAIDVRLEGEWIHFIISMKLEAVALEGKEDEVITSAPSSLYESLVKVHERPDAVSAEEENKNSLIDDLQQKNRQSVLIVEDEPELRFLIRNVLKEHYIIYEAGNGRAALQFLQKTVPSLIISDVMMPDMDGLELCRAVKQTPALAQIPFVILSARGTEDHKTEGYEVGADAYIPKPFQINYLQVRIRKLLDYQERMQHLIKDQHITNQFMDADIADADKQFLEALLKAIEQNLNEPDLNAATLEDALSISKMQLYRRLKSLAGMTPAEFIKRIRLKHAADMLLSSQYTVSEIFYRTGFNNKSYFFREFKKIYRCAPNEYRQQYFEENTPIL